MKTNSWQIMRSFKCTPVPKERIPAVWRYGFFRNYTFLLLFVYLNFASSNCLPQRPYIDLFIIFNLLLVPSTKPLLKLVNGKPCTCHWFCLELITPSGYIWAHFRSNWGFEYEDDYDQILCYGISFFKKRCMMKKKWSASVKNTKHQRID